MIRVLSSLLIILALFATAYSQNEQLECSQLSVTGPPAVIQPGDSHFFDAKLVPEIDPAKFLLKWTVENGEILAGQGTMRIEVSSPPPGLGTRATAEVTGLGACNQTASDTGVICSCPEPLLIDEFNDLPKDELRSRIEKLISRLESEPTSTGYIINYGKAGSVKKRESLIRMMVGERCGRDGCGSDLLILDGGSDEENETVIRTRIWIVPLGTDASIVN